MRRQDKTASGRFWILKTTYRLEPCQYSPPIIISEKSNVRMFLIYLPLILCTWSKSGFPTELRAFSQLRAAKRRDLDCHYNNNNCAISSIDFQETTKDKLQTLPLGTLIAVYVMAVYKVLISTVVINCLLKGTIKSLGVMMMELDSLGVDTTVAAWIPAIAYTLFSVMSTPVAR